MKKAALFFIGFLLTYFSYSQSCTNGFFQVYVPGSASASTFGKYDPITDTYVNHTLKYQGSPIAFKLNAVGYNSLDGFIYGIATTAGNGISAGALVKINPMTDVLTVVSTPANWSLTTAKTFYVGDITTTGVYYVTLAGTNKSLYKYTIATNTLSIQTVSIPVCDWAYIPSKNKFYGVDGTKLYSYDPTTGVVSVAISLTATTGSTYNFNNESGAWGAAWTASDGFLYAANNTTGRMYRIDLTSNTARFLSNAQATGTNDGTSCPTAPSPFIPNLVVRKRTSTPVVAPNGIATYTLEVVNYGADPASNVYLVDSLPTGFSLVAVTGVSKTGTVAGPTSPVNSGTTSILKWGSYTIPGDDTIAITFTVQTSSILGTYDNCGTSTTTTTGAAITAYDCRGNSNENVRVANPILTVTETTTTPSVTNSGTATYTIKVKNTGSTASAVNIKNLGLPAGFTYTGGATYTQGTTTGTAINGGTSTSPEFGYYTIGYNDSVTITFNVTLGANVCGVQHSSATATTNTANATINPYNGLINNNEDITIIDNIAPTVICHSDVTINANTSGCRANVANIGITATDNCGIQSTAWAISGATTATGSNNASGQFFNVGTSYVNYTVTDNAGNITTCAFEVKVINSLAVSTTTTPVTACGLKNGTLTLTATGGTAPYLYQLGGGIFDTTRHFHLLQEGAYEFTVKDVHGCESNGIDTVTSNCIEVFPVQWASFEAETQGSKVQLKWVTATEIQNSHFDVQASQNGTIFETVGTMVGAGNSSSLRQYRFTHNFPTLGKNYYRIKQIDIDGTATYSDIETILFERGNEAINVYPNPVTEGLLNIALSGTKFMESSHIQASLIDITGNIVLHTTLNPSDFANTDLQWDLSQVTSGMYFLTIANGNNLVETVKVEVK